MRPTRAARTSAPAYYQADGSVPVENGVAPAPNEVVVPAPNGVPFPAPHLLASVRRHTGAVAARRPSLRLPNGVPRGDAGNSSADEGEGHL